MIDPENLMFDYGWVADDAQDLANALNSDEPDFINANPDDIRTFIDWASDKADSISGMLETIACAYEDYLYDLENPDEDE